MREMISRNCCTLSLICPHTAPCKEEGQGEKDGRQDWAPCWNDIDAHTRRGADDWQADTRDREGWENQHGGIHAPTVGRRGGYSGTRMGDGVAGRGQGITWPIFWPDLAGAEFGRGGAMTEGSGRGSAAGPASGTATRSNAAAGGPVCSAHACLHLSSLGISKGGAVLAVDNGPTVVRVGEGTAGPGPAWAAAAASCFASDAGKHGVLCACLSTTGRAVASTPPAGAVISAGYAGAVAPAEPAIGSLRGEGALHACAFACVCVHGEVRGCKEGLPASERCGTNEACMHRESC